MSFIENESIVTISLALRKTEFMLIVFLEFVKPQFDQPETLA